ncbi:MAG: hypothetical protein KDD62_13970, partial [Bdellovibrionales bacterium]|nr:hypothetical protein [Bdellovibrionales bacterium]
MSASQTYWLVQSVICRCLALVPSARGIAIITSVVMTSVLGLVHSGNPLQTSGGLQKILAKRAGL